MDAAQAICLKINACCSGQWGTYCAMPIMFVHVAGSWLGVELYSCCRRACKELPWAGVVDQMKVLAS